MNMNMNFNLNLTQEQKLIMTQQMQLSIKLLQMSSFELIEHIDKETQENPVIELSYVENADNNEQNSESRIDYKELIKYLEFDNYSSRSYEKSDEDEISPLNFVSEKKSLKEYLSDQIADTNVKDYLRAACLYIIDNLDSRGYLDSPLVEICEDLNITLESAEEALEIVQSLDPPGIGSRNLSECLCLQLMRKNIFDEVLFNIIENHLGDIAENRYNSIAKVFQIEPIKVQEYADTIKKLEPKPSSGFYTGDEISFIIPDAYIRKIGEDFHIIMNESSLPKLNINENYKAIIKEDKDKQTVEYVKDKINSALFLIKSIENRKSTIYKVLKKIVEIQREYFEQGENYLKPMTLKDIAESIEMHESTISRAIKDKYISIDRGTIRIKDLFTAGLSSNNLEDVSTTIIKREIKQLISNEEKSKPMSDQAICDILNEKGMNISRRTVAKYREEMNIKTSSKRKRL